jgi:hypothetical protein
LRPLLGRFVTSRSYESIGRAFRPASVAAEDLSLAGTNLTAAGMDRAASLLDRHGVVVLRDFVDSALIEAARHEADLLTERLQRAIATASNDGEMGNILWQVGGARFPSHRMILAHGRPLANLRSRKRGTINGGIIDLFFLDRAARENGWTALLSCCACLQSGHIARIITAVSRTRPQQVNMLRNDSVTATRGLHVDNLDGSYKAFLYLSDVRGLADGPFAYVPGSHRRPDLLRREARLNSLKGIAENDSYAFNGREIAVAVSQGSVIISCQSGVHRGMPQQMGASRTVLVGNYRA